MPTATTTKEDSCSKLVQNHPHDFTKKPVKIGVLLDVETTGLDAKTDKLIELGMVKLAYHPDGRVAHVDR
jgi:DNA polymerase III epsilon subunit-like protein